LFGLSDGLARGSALSLAGPSGEPSGARVGFLAQSPQGPGCTAVVDSITCQPTVPADLRDGS
jgi:hypothetical protein